jgi:hypothetical protein
MRGLGIVIVFFTLISCGKEEAEPSSFDLIQTRILDTNCAISGCHQSAKDVTFSEHGLVLEKSVAYQNLVNQKPKNVNALKDNLLRYMYLMQRKVCFTIKCIFPTIIRLTTEI